jgi:hypothetical protein
MRNKWLIAVFLLAGCLALAQTTTVAPTDKTVEVSASSKWTDTGIDLHAGDVVDLSAQVTESSSTHCDPQGNQDMANPGKLPVESALPGSLIAKLQDKSDAPIYVGAERQIKVTADGRLFLAANLGPAAGCSGKYSVRVHVAPGAAAGTTSYKDKLANAAQVWLSGQMGGPKPTANVTPSDASLPASSDGNGAAAASIPAKRLIVSTAPLDSQLAQDLQALPRRVNDEFKNPGDMVNFVLIGSEKQVQDALTAANWHVADTSTPNAVARAIMMATQKEDYLQMPMSQLYLFGRVQDFGYEQAEPIAMVASRHHFRIWKSTLAFKGQTVWAGAGTHDVGFEKDQRNGKVTHKIDPAVDGERDNIGESLQLSGHVRWMSYFSPNEPVLESKNATGGGFHSDGRVLVIFLQ